MVIKILIFYSALYLSLSWVSCDENLEASPESVFIPDVYDDPNLAKIVTLIESFETIYDLHLESPINPTKSYEAMKDILIQLNDIIDSKIKATAFFQAKGIDRIIVPTLDIGYVPYRDQLLIFIKTLFTVFPSMTRSHTPTHLLDKIVHIFEKEDLGLKARAIDILNLWLPSDPIAQTRVMKTKGLDPFYEQLKDLDYSVIFSMIHMFNGLIIDHVRAKEWLRNNPTSNKLKKYEAIGLLERLSTPRVCEGLLNIFAKVLEYDITMKDESEYGVTPIFHLMRLVQHFCIDSYKNNVRANSIFKELLKYLREPSNSEYFDSVFLDVDEAEAVLQKYIMHSSNDKEEL